MATMKVVRDSGYPDRFRAYQIILDGEKAGEIREGQTVEISIPSGQHELSFKIDWCGSKPVRFTVADIGSVAFRVKSGIRNQSALRALWNSLTQPDTYLEIEAEPRS